MSTPADVSSRVAVARDRRLRAFSARAITYLYIAPALAFYSLFFLRPFVEVIRLSLLDWDGIGPQHFVGVKNYRKLFTDSAFWQAFAHNVGWMLAGIVVPTAIALASAIVLVRARIHGRTAFRALLFLPQVLSTVVVALAWGWIYNPYGGALDQTLTTVGLPRQDWLGAPSLVLPSLFAVWAWITYGFGMVVLGAALQTIDESYVDAARVDGAGRLQQLWFVLLPAIRRPLSVVILINVITAFQVFDLVFIMTNGGPFGSSNVLALYMYDNAFQFNRVGYGSTIAVTLGSVILAVSLVFLWVTRLTRDGE